MQLATCWPVTDDLAKVTGFAPGCAALQQAARAEDGTVGRERADARATSRGWAGMARSPPSHLISQSEAQAGALSQRGGSASRGRGCRVTAPSLLCCAGGRHITLHRNTQRSKTVRAGSKRNWLPKTVQGLL